MTPFAACTLKDRECPADQKPDLKSVEPKACNTHACPTYEWVASYGDCVAKCDSGIHYDYHKSILDGVTQGAIHSLRISNTLVMNSIDFKELPWKSFRFNMNHVRRFA